MVLLWETLGLGSFFYTQSGMTVSLDKQALGLLWCLWGCSTGKGGTCNIQTYKPGTGNLDRRRHWSLVSGDWQRPALRANMNCQCDGSPLPLEPQNSLQSVYAPFPSMRDTMPVWDRTLMMCVRMALQMSWCGPINSTLGTPAPRA